MSIETYLDRNLAVCSSYGVKAACDVSLERLAKMKRPPKWLVEKFKAIAEREERMRRHLIDHSNEAKASLTSEDSAT
jgi:hypothetical protein